MTRPSRREIERAIDALQPPVPADERLDDELTDAEKAHLDQMFAFDPDEGKTEWQRRQWQQLLDACAEAEEIA
jgi:hypothetical protein